MKQSFVFQTVLWLCLTQILQAQNPVIGPKDSLKQYLGVYEFAGERYTVRLQDGNLLLEISGQGHVALKPGEGDKFRADRVNPEAFIEFIKDSLGQVTSFRWIQTVGALKWNRVNDDNDSLPASTDSGKYSLYTGHYRNKKFGMDLRISEDSGHLITHVASEGTVMKFSQLSESRFVYQPGTVKFDLSFEKMQDGKFQEIVQTRSGPPEFFKVPADETSAATLVSKSSSLKNGFSRADTLQGMLTPFRTCFDVLFYSLAVTINPAARSIAGTNIIRFKATRDFTKMQVDLFANLKIDHIRYHGVELMFKREFNAVFIEFTEKVNQNAVEEIEIVYSGRPQVADPVNLTGGFIWYHDKNNNPWIETVSQGIGASVWWPCKDHLSDKPDSMKISVTIPQGLSEISNGVLKSKTNLPGSLTRFDWSVNYPITNYNVVVNIGDYVHFTDQLLNGTDTLNLNYYSLTYNRKKAEQIFSEVKPMLLQYEKWFGRYPFAGDGFTAMESLYPMEHQSAVSIGSINNPVNSNKFDLKELTRTMWHEVAHEWWGNSITCSDMADLWIHEAFATYTETLNFETFYDKKSAQKHLHAEPPGNNEPIIGVYNVNNFHLGDMYSKGALMLHTFRSIIANDSVFFGLLKSLQTDLMYQTVNTDMLVNYINQKTGKDFTSFFDQYLRFSKIPELDLKFTNNDNKGLVLHYRWIAEAKNFAMPIGISKTKGEWSLLYPTTEWKDLELPAIKLSDFKVDTNNYYITVKQE